MRIVQTLVGSRFRYGELLINFRFVNKFFIATKRPESTGDLGI
jgi:hypothetical protein